MVQYDCKESEGVFLWVLYKGVYMRGLYKGVYMRGIFSHGTPHRGHTQTTPHTERQTDQCVTVEEVAHTVHTEE